MVKKNDSIAIIVSLFVVILLLIGLCICCTRRRPSISNSTPSSISDSEKGSAVAPPPVSRGPLSLGTDGGFNAPNGRGNITYSPPHRPLAADGGFNVGSRRLGRAESALRPNGGFNVGSRQNSRTTSRAGARESRASVIPNVPHDQAFDTPGPPRRERGVLRNDRPEGSRGPSRVSFQPSGGGFNVVENQDGGFNVTAQGTDGAFNVAGGTGQSAQAHQRGVQGGSTSVNEPGPGSETSGGFNIG
ncbi:hypothetical protein BS50DRAFT_318991 [Corynespora cassiicola Philippines]|uniref:Uncharacterized protein n=1 Tax=Corynespora cassiicola Philippines TaxID=1448308 RepID=A0A2T2NT01_CORCC|nr:hypothetical protein BS50DRAFT_318991 [Corynespora cassiicola Philippines]